MGPSDLIPSLGLRFVLLFVPCSRYHRLYLACKGNKYKTKKQLMEAVHKMKSEKAAEKALKDLAEQKKARAKKARERKAAKAQAISQ